MSKKDIVIVGGSAAGISAAISARRNYPEKSILLIRRETQVPIPCGIPYVFGTLSSPEQNLISDSILDKNGVELSISQCESMDVKARKLLTSVGAVEYERLVVATGSTPVVPPIPGTELDGVFTIRKEMDYLRRVKERASTAKSVLVVGGGFIGVEFADEIVKTPDTHVTIVEMLANCLELSYDAEFCDDIESRLRDRGIEIYTSTRVEGLQGNGSVQSAILSNGETLDIDMVILGIGVKANTELAAAAGLAIGRSGGIVVDRTMQTSVPGVFACGDCTEKTSFFGGRPSTLKLASIATQEARIAGANLFEIRRQGIGTVGVWSTMITGLALGTAGLTETAARAMGYQVVAASVEGPNRHPGVMPGGAPTKLKLVFDASSGILLGGQARGGDSVGEMINSISALVQKTMRADEIVLFQMGTHPALTASPIAYQLVNAAEIACSSIK